MALPLGELSPQATERGKASFLPVAQVFSTHLALSVLALLGHLSQGERQEGARKAPLVSQGELARKRLRG